MINVFFLKFIFLVQSFIFTVIYKSIGPGKFRGAVLVRITVFCCYDLGWILGRGAEVLQAAHSMAKQKEPGEQIKVLAKQKEYFFPSLTELQLMCNLVWIEDKHHNDLYVYICKR